MGVKIGSARSDERGKISGGKAGDQTGKEVMIQNWYPHSKVWVMLRPKDPSKAKLIALAMEALCANNNIGYDQYQRNTLHDLAKLVDFDPALVTTKCETDCSAAVRVCCKRAGIDAPDFTTANEASKLMATGAFEKYTDAKHTKSPDYLRAGDILVTRTKGHTVVVLSDGAKAHLDDNASDGALGDGYENQYTAPDDADIIRKGRIGNVVRWVQWELIESGYDCGEDGIDGDFGPNTFDAVLAFQAAHDLEVDGEVGPLTRDELIAEIAGEDGLPGDIGDPEDVDDAEPDIEPVQKEQAAPPSALPYDLDAEAGIIIDVSYCDTNVNWKKIKAAVGDKKVIFVILRAMGRYNKIDAMFKKHLAGVKANGIPYGVYAYSYAEKAPEAVAESEALVKIVRDAGAEPLAWYFDSEESKAAQTTQAAAKAWLTRMRVLVPNGYLRFYSFDSRCVSWKSIVKTFDGCWSARWNGKKMIPPSYPNYDLWQYGTTKPSGTSRRTDTSKLRPGLTLRTMLYKQEGK